VVERVRHLLERKPPCGDKEQRLEDELPLRVDKPRLAPAGKSLLATRGTLFLSKSSLSVDRKRLLGNSGRLARDNETLSLALGRLPGNAKPTEGNKMTTPANPEPLSRDTR
jgi:hypothetical protein